MSLTGTNVLVLTGLLAAAVTVLTVVLWRRLGGPGLGQVVARVGLVVLAQALAVLLAGLALNDYGYFYGSWGELLGWTHPSGQIRHGRLNASGRLQVSTLIPAQVGGAARAASSPRWSRLGRFDQVQVHGAISGLSEHADVYLPPEYFQKAWSHRSFPAALLMTGYPSANHAVSRLLRFATAERRDVRLGRAQPVVLVMMTPNPAFPRDTECTDIPGGPQVMTFFAQDVPQAVSSTFRVRHGGWGVAGDSTGGYCATKFAMTYPSVFSAAVSLSGYYAPVQDQTTGNLWGGSTVLRNLNSPEWRLAHLPPPPIFMLVTSGTGERGRKGISDARRFVALAKPPMQVDTLYVRGGAHNFGTWDKEIPQAMTWLSAHLSKVPGYP